MDCGNPSINRYIYITAPASMTQGTSWKKEWIDLRIPRNFLRKCLINKSRANVIPIKLMLRKRKSYVLPLDKDLQTTNESWEKEN